MLEDSSFSFFFFSFFFFRKSCDCNEIREFFFVRILFSLFSFLPFSLFSFLFLFFLFGRSCSRFLINCTQLTSDLGISIIHFQSFDYFDTKQSSRMLNFA